MDPSTVFHYSQGPLFFSIFHKEQFLIVFVFKIVLGGVNIKIEGWYVTFGLCNICARVKKSERYCFNFSDNGNNSSVLIFPSLCD